MRYSLILAIAFALLAVGCSDAVNDAKPDEPMSYGKAVAQILSGSVDWDSTHGNIGILHWRLDGSTGRDDVYQTGGSIFDSNNPSTRTRVDGGTMTISSATVSANSANDYLYEANITGSWDVSSATFSIAGNGGIPAFSTTMPILKKIVLNNTLAGTTVSKSTPPTLTWNADANNSDGVLVYVRYLVATSNRYNSSLPDTGIVMSKVVSDNGSYALTAGDMSAFPVGAVVDIGVARATWDVRGSTRKYVIHAGTTAYGEATIGN